MADPSKIETMRGADSLNFRCPACGHLTPRHVVDPADAHLRTHAEPGVPAEAAVTEQHRILADEGYGIEESDRG